MSTADDDTARNVLPRSLARAAAFLGFWLILAGPDPKDLPVGVLAAVIATWASQRLLPPRRSKLHPAEAIGFALRFLRQSINAGIDVALRALDPRLPLRPGFVVYRPQLPPGFARNGFCSVMSLLPGTLPAGPDGSSGLAIHCLDVSQPVVEQLAMEEALLIDAFGGPRQ